MASDGSSFLRQLYPHPPMSNTGNDAEIDVVAVHGLDPFNKSKHAYNTWTADGRLW
jgi:hypothetical protein